MPAEVAGATTADRFEVRIDGEPIGVSYVGGITSSRSREGDGSLAPIVLRRAVGADQALWRWHAEAPERRAVSVALLADDGAPTVTWHLEGCRAVRWSGPTLDALHPVVACEELEIAFDRVTWS